MSRSRKLWNLKIWAPLFGCFYSQAFLLTRLCTFCMQAYGFGCKAAEKIPCSVPNKTAILMNAIIIYYSSLALCAYITCVCFLLLRWKNRRTADQCMESDSNKGHNSVCGVNMTLCRVQWSQCHAVERCSYIIHGFLCWESIYLEVEAKMQF